MSPHKGEAIAAAESSIHLEAYIFRDGVIGRQMVQALAEPTRAGVAVRLLLDAVGSTAFGAENEELLREACARWRQLVAHAGPAVDRAVRPERCEFDLGQRVLHRPPRWSPSSGDWIHEARAEGRFRQMTPERLAGIGAVGIGWSPFVLDGQADLRSPGQLDAAASRAAGQFLAGAAAVRLPFSFRDAR